MENLSPPTFEEIILATPADERSSSSTGTTVQPDDTYKHSYDVGLENMHNTPEGIAVVAILAVASFGIAVMIKLQK